MIDRIDRINSAHLFTPPANENHTHIIAGENEKRFRKAVTRWLFFPTADLSPPCSWIFFASIPLPHVCNSEEAFVLVTCTAAWGRETVRARKQVSQSLSRSDVSLSGLLGLSDRSALIAPNETYAPLCPLIFVVAASGAGAGARAREGRGGDG